MRTLRAAWFALTLSILVVLWLRDGAAQQEPRPPMPPNLFTVHKLTDRLSIIAPYGPDMSQVGGQHRRVRHRRGRARRRRQLLHAGA